MIFAISSGAMAQVIERDASQPDFSHSVAVVGKCRILVDPRIELLSVVQWLADDPVIKTHDPDPAWGSYRRALEEYFARYRQHSVVGLMKRLRAGGFAYGRIPELTLRLDDELRLRTDAVDGEEYLRKAGTSRAAMIEFLDALCAFRRDSDFDRFHAHRASYHSHAVERTRAVLEKTRALEEVVRFFGYEQASCSLVLYPLAAGGFAERLPAANGRFAVYVFVSVPAKERDLVRLMIHEVGHSYTGPLAYTTHAVDLGRRSRLFVPIERSMRRQNYHSWINCVDEHVNRAVVARLLQRLYGGTAGHDELQACRQRGFAYVEAIHERLLVYEKSRDRFRTFDEFYPEIVGVFAALDG